jgi:hypothetical protein
VNEEKKPQYDWRFENSINTKTEYLEIGQAGEFKYEPFRTNKALCNHVDTVIYANEMNINYNLDYKLQYDYLFNVIRKKKRTFKNRGKKTKDLYFAAVQEYYHINNKKTHEALAVLNEAQLELIIRKVDKGGIK